MNMTVVRMFCSFGVCILLLGLTPMQERFLAAPRSERERIIADESARKILAERTTPEIEGTFNFRDLGGKVGFGGRTVRRGLLYRSARFDQIGEVGRNKIVGDLGVRTDLDLRSPKETAGLQGVSPLGTNVVFRLVPLLSYELVGTKGGEAALREALKVVFEPANWPLAFHCKTGKDRTGTLAFVLLALLGVNEDAICLDWEKTAFHVPELSRMDHPSRYDRLLQYFSGLPGATLPQKVEGYVLRLGFTQEEVRGFRERMLGEIGGFAENIRPLPELSVTNLKVRVGARHPFSVLHVSDSHLLRVDSRLSDDQLAFALTRSRKGREFGEYYLDRAMAQALRDGVTMVHSGDLVEFAGAANFESAGRRLRSADMIACPGNHEYWLSENRRNVESNRVAVADALARMLPDGASAWTREIEGVNFFVFDNASQVVSGETVDRFERVVRRGLPIVLVCHVPLWSDDFGKATCVCGGPFGPRDARTDGFVERVRREPLVKAVLSGHLHRRVISAFSPTAVQIVSGALFNGQAQRIDFE